MTIKQMGREAVTPLIHDINDMLRAMVDDPDTKQPSAEEVVVAARALLSAWGGLLEASSTSAGFAVRDLRPPEADAYDRAMHRMRVLDAMYMPRDVTS